MRTTIEQEIAAIADPHVKSALILINHRQDDLAIRLAHVKKRQAQKYLDKVTHLQPRLPRGDEDVFDRALEAMRNEGAV